MINSAKEARGGLYALEHWPEVRSLVQNYQELLRELAMFKPGIEMDTPRIRKWKEALAQYKSAIGGKE